MTLALLVEDISTGLILGEIAYSKLSFGQTVNESTGWSVDLPTGTAAGLLDPARRIIHVDDAGEILYSGIVWATRVQGDTFTASGSDLFSYLAARTMRRDIPPLDYVDDDQFDIVTDIVSNIMFNDGGALGIQVRRNPNLTGTVRTVSYHPWERKPYSEAITDLAEAEGGFEWRMASEWASGTVNRFLDVWFPRVGRVTNIVWEDDYQIGITQRFVDGSRYANRVALLGYGSDALKVVGEAVQVPAGYPRLDGVLTRTDVTDATFANDLAAGELARRTQLAETMTVQVHDPGTLGEWITGDQVYVVSERLSVEGYYRIVSWTATDDSGGFTVNAELALGLPSGKPVRVPVAQMLRDDRETARAVARLEGQ